MCMCVYIFHSGSWTVEDLEEFLLSLSPLSFVIRSYYFRLLLFFLLLDVYISYIDTFFYWLNFLTACHVTYSSSLVEWSYGKREGWIFTYTYTHTLLLLFFLLLLLLPFFSHSLLFFFLSFISISIEYLQWSSQVEERKKPPLNQSPETRTGISNIMHKSKVVSSISFLLIRSIDYTYIRSFSLCLSQLFTYPWINVVFTCLLETEERERKWSG